MTNKKPLSLESRMKSGRLLKAKAIIRTIKDVSEYETKCDTIDHALKNHDQSVKSDKEFLEKSKLYAFMTQDPERAYWKEELAWHFGVDKRTIRAMVAEMANHAPVVALSSSKGYRVVKLTDQMDKDDLKAVLSDVEHQLNELMSRAANLKARMKPLMACRAEICSRLDK